MRIIHLKCLYVAFFCFHKLNISPSESERAAICLQDCFSLKYFVYTSSYYFQGAAGGLVVRPLGL